MKGALYWCAVVAFQLLMVGGGLFVAYHSWWTDR